MIKRSKTITVDVGGVRIGGRAPIVIQSMTKVPTVDVSRCVRQINTLIRKGCRLVRVSVPRKADTRAFAAIVDRVDIPLIADVHFSRDRAVEAIEAGAAKIRLNPGNIKSRSDINAIIDAAKAHKVAIRVGVNEASIRDLAADAVPEKKRTALMLREMSSYIRIFEKRGFEQLVLSAKSSDPLRTIEINRAIADRFRYPIHLGLTHAGLPSDATIPSAVALGTLLAEGIGDTIRVSAAGNPAIETAIACRILESLNLLPRNRPELIVCPTCARAEIDIVTLARKVEKALAKIDRPLRIAVMGCVVNGPGEAADADLAVCAAKNKGFIYRHGRKIATVPEDKLIPELLEQLGKL